MVRRDHKIDRRNVLKHLGIAGTAGVFAGNAVAADDLSAQSDRIDDIWDGLVDYAYDKISSGITPSGEELSTAELQETYSAEDVEGDEVTPESLASKFLKLMDRITPTSVPFDICGEQDLIFDADRICTQATNIWDSVIDECPTSRPIYKVGFGVNHYQKGFNDDWSLEVGLSPWLGFADNGCMYAGLSEFPIEQCSLIGCKDDLIDPTTAAIGSVVDAGMDIIRNAYEGLPTELPLVLKWALVALLAIGLILAAIAAAAGTGASGGTLPAAGAAAIAVGGALASAWS
ncbi:twin-arginine translocation signal domain-containing protein [Halorussus amylolyticus]|uniref:twin-arginine translocation signal domain-containing protein n=1 Tax=Halorussus amylolyticus TaxID=1126242 RepID=UPI00138ED079|nr:twin-arginine translocation signal domain-containing protein [Halorussus amylolyticus]